MLARDDLFDGVPQYDVQMKGQSLKLPVFYRDASSVTAIFPAKASEVRRMLPSPSLRPLLLAPGIGTLAITFLEYRDSDIGPYNSTPRRAPTVPRDTRAKTGRSELPPRR